MTTYTVRWRRPGDDEIMECSGLTLRTAFARLLNVLRSNDQITVYSVKRDA